MLIPQENREWDYYWDYTMGLPENNGVTKGTNGTVYISMQDDGLNIYTNIGWGNRAQYNFPVKKPTTGVFEVSFIPHTNGGNNGVCSWQCSLGNDDYGVRLNGSRNKIKLYDNEQYGLGTDVANLPQDVETTLKIVLKGDAFDVYVNDVKKISDRSATGMLYSTTTLFVVGGVTSPYYVKLRSLKYKVNRIE